MFTKLIMGEGKHKSAVPLQVFTACALVVLSIHFVLTLTYCFRDHLPYRPVAVADRYAIPMFHQNWKLFAPELPRYNMELEFRYAHLGQWSPWKDASGGFGFGRCSGIETIEQGFNSGLAWQVMNNFYSVKGVPQFDRITRSPDYARSLFFAMQLQKTILPMQVPDSVQIRVDFRFAPDPGSDSTGRHAILEFPVYAPQP